MKGRLLDRRVAATYAEWFRALSDPTRVQLVALLSTAGRPLSVGELTEAMPVGQSTVSHHLAVLVSVGFAQVERVGTSSRYAVNRRCVDRFPTAADVVMGRQPADPVEGCGQCRGDQVDQVERGEEAAG